MILTKENYHTPESRREYLSSSRYKDFCGCLGFKGCEERALAMDRGDWKECPTDAMRVSSYIDNHFSGGLDIFKAQNPEIVTKQGSLKAQFIHANEIIERIERDEYFMKYMSGEKQIIMTAELFGMNWSVMIDSYIPDVAIVDLKVMQDLKKSHYVPDIGKVSFIEFYGYLEQGAIYQAVVQKKTGKVLPFYIAAASKEEYPDIEIIGFTQDDLNRSLEMIELNIERIKLLKSGGIIPTFCGECDYCRETKVLTAPIHYSQLI